MAEIRTYPLVRHYRGDQTAQTLYFRSGKAVKAGRGLTFWFRPLSTAAAEVPLDDREVPFLFHGRTADFQQAVVQGVVAYRISDPANLAERVDFSVDLDSGLWRKAPLDQLSGLVTQLAQGLAHDYLARTELVSALRDGVDQLRSLLAAGLADDTALVDMGVEIIAVRVNSVQPTSEMDKALQTPTRETIQQQADEATFARRALAVDKERAIAENEMANKVELARREDELIAQEGNNDRHRATDRAEAQRITTEAAAAKRETLAGAEARSVQAVDGARVEVERNRLSAYREVPAEALIALAAKELAANLGKIDHLYLTPDMVGPALARFIGSGQDAPPTRAGSPVAGNLPGGNVGPGNREIDG